MNKELDFEVEELGVASIETKGPPQGVGEIHGLLGPSGISDLD